MLRLQFARWAVIISTIGFLSTRFGQDQRSGGLERPRIELTHSEKDRFLNSLWEKPALVLQIIKEVDLHKLGFRKLVRLESWKGVTPVAGADKVEVNEITKWLETPSCWIYNSFWGYPFLTATRTMCALFFTSFEKIIFMVSQLGRVWECPKIGHGWQQT